MAWLEYVQFVRSQVIPLMNEVVIAVIIVLIGLILGQVLGMILKRLLGVFEIDALLSKLGLKFPAENFVSQGLKMVMYIFFFIIALNTLGISQYVTYMISAVVMIVLFVSGVLYLKDCFPNWFVGYKIRRKKIFGVGDRIKTGSIEGKVVDFNLRETMIQTKKGDVLLIPNYELLRQGLMRRK